MTGKQLRNSILQWAIQGKLVPQDPNDEPASVLLERIRAEKARLIKEKKIKRDKNETIIYRGEDNSYYEKTLSTGAVRCIDDEIPFDIPDSWAWCRLGEISTYAQPKRKINASKADSQSWGLDLEDIEKGGRLLNIRAVGERKAIGDKTIFNCGDILYSKLRPYLLKILVAPKDGICTPEIIPFSCYGNIRKEYIVNFLKAPYVDDHINSSTFGVKMPRVSTETMTYLLVPLPPLSEQIRIEKRIEELMPFIEKYGKAQDSLNTLNNGLSDSVRRSILQEAIQGRLVPQIESEGTAEELFEEIRTEKKRLVKDGKLKKSAIANESRIFRGDDNKYYEQIGHKVFDISDVVPFDIPDSWQWVRLNHIGMSELGKTMDKGKDSGENLPYLCSINVYWDGVNLDKVKTAQFTPNEKEKYKLQFGDLLVCEGGDVGRCAIWQERVDMWFQNALHRITLFNDINAQYIKYILEFYKFTGSSDQTYYANSIIFIIVSLTAFI